MPNDRLKIISKTCLDSVDFFKKSDKEVIKNSWDINNGSCFDFADLVCLKLDKCHGINNIIQIDDNLLSSFFFKEINENQSDKKHNILSSIIYSIKNNLDNYRIGLHISDFIIELQPHVWLCDLETGMFFDAELPFGSADITMLPYIERNIWGTVIDNSDYYSSKPNELEKYLNKNISKMLFNDYGNNYKIMSANELVNDCNYLCKSLKINFSSFIKSIKSNASFSEIEKSIEP